MAKSRINKKRFEDDLSEAGSTRDYEKKEDMRNAEETYFIEEKIEAERDFLTRTGAGALRQVKLKSEVEGKEIIEIPKDKAVFSYELDSEIEEEKENGLDEQDTEEDAEDVD